MTGRDGRALTAFDCMRALTTVAIVLIHTLGVTARWPPTLGYLPRSALLLFFVHTSFVLLRSLERQEHRATFDMWRRFMVRRCCRIFPLSIVVVMLILVFEIPSQYDPPAFHFLHLTAAGIAANLCLVMNLTGSTSLLSPMWSLPYEFQLYALLPAIHVLLSARRPVAAACALWCGAMLLAWMQTRTPHSARLDIVQFLPAFMSGALGYAVSERVKPWLPFGWWPGLLGACMCLPWPWVGCLLTACLAPIVREADSGWTRDCLHWVAEHSYAIYLAHYFCLWLSFRVIQWPAGQWMVFVVSIVSIPVCLHRAVELPMIRLGRWASGVPS